MAEATDGGPHRGSDKMRPLTEPVLQTLEKLASQRRNTKLAPDLVQELVRSYRAQNETIQALQSCQAWFERWSPTAELVNNMGRTHHPMLTMIKKALK